MILSFFSVLGSIVLFLQTEILAHKTDLCICAAVKSLCQTSSVYLQVQF